MINLLLLTCLLLSPAASPLDSTKAKRDDKIHFKPIPVIAYAPETRFLFGVGAVSTFRLSHDSGTNYSLVSCFVAYTQNNQDYIYVPYQLYTRHNDYYFEGEADYYNYSYYYWGIGTDRVAKELFNVSFPRFYCNAFRKVFSKFYAGIDYYYENDRIFNKQTGGALITGEVPGSDGSVNSGLGLCAYFDTRDSVYFPTHGWYIKATSYINSPATGSNFAYNKIISDVSWFGKLAKPVVLALNEHSIITWGDVPFNQMGLVGGRYFMRGFYTGYYRDDYFTMLQAEARIHLIGRLGFDVFGATGFIGNSHTFPETPSPIFAEGAGLRYNYDKRQHVNVRLDVGIGNGMQLYLTVLEAF